MSEFDMEVSDGNKHRKAGYHFIEAILLPSLNLITLENYQEEVGTSASS